LDGITLQDLLDKKKKGYPDDYIIWKLFHQTILQNLFFSRKIIWQTLRYRVYW
jgi:hypothetical protein